MLDDLSKVSVTIAGVVIILKIVKELIREMNSRKPGNGSSGEKPVDFWRQVIKEVIREELEHIDAAIERNNTNINQTRHTLAGPLTPIMLKLEVIHGDIKRIIP